MSHRVLLVEDEAALLRLMTMYLGRLGYGVDPCPCAADALKLLEEDADRYQLAIADLTLPDMPGLELFERMIAMQPKLRVLICSGYAFDMSSLPEHLQRCSAFLQKPFLPNMLSQALQDLIRR